MPRRADSAETRGLNSKTLICSVCERFERSEIDVSRAGRTMIARGKFNVVDMKAGESGGGEFSEKFCVAG